MSEVVFGLNSSARTVTWTSGNVSLKQTPEDIPTIPAPTTAIRTRFPAAIFLACHNAGSYGHVQDRKWPNRDKRARSGG